MRLHAEVPGRLPGRDETPLPMFPGEMLELGSKTIFVRSTRQRADASRQAVYVHGLGGSARNWTDLMALLEPVAPGIAPDLLGFGRSPMPEDHDYSQRAHSDIVIKLIERTCSQPVDLFGNSMGGAISTRIAAKRPDLVRTLTLVSPALPNLKPRPGTLSIAAMANPGIRMLAEKLTGPMDPDRAVQRMYDLCYADQSRVHPDRHASQMEETRWRFERPNADEPLRMSARGLVRKMLPGQPGNIWNYAKRVECPTLIIFGTQDKLVDARLAPKAASMFPNAHVVTLDTGHVAQLEEPQKVARMVLQMWAEQG